MMIWSDTMDFTKLSSLKQKYSVQASLPDFNNKISCFKKKYNLSASVSEKKTAAVEVETVTAAVRVNNQYLRNLIQSLEKIKPILIERDYKKVREMFEKIIRNDDYDDDIEDTMGQIHGIIEKHIYKSFSKVKPESRVYISDFLKKAGYALVNVKPGSDAKRNAQYFENMFPVKTSNFNLKGKISQIDNQPYEISYYDDDNYIKKLILGGICAFYQ